MGIELICLDADDTLWHNMRYFNRAQDELFALLSDFAESERTQKQLESIQRRNLQLYGYGVKGYTLSAIETALELAGDQLPIRIVRQLLEAGRALHSHPVELFPGVLTAVQQLGERAPVILVTKGDLIHQESKIASSGIGALLTGVEIVSEKNPAAFLKIFDRYNVGPSKVLVAGDSVRSDVLPALETGAYAALVPNIQAWALESAEPPRHQPRFRMVADLQGVVAWTDELNARLDQGFDQSHRRAI